MSIRLRRAGLLAAVLLACGGDDSSAAPGADGGANDGSSNAPAYAACGGAIFDGAGNVDATEYRKQARLWDKKTIDCRLGPKYADLHPTPETFPTAWEPPHIASNHYLCKTYEYSGTCPGTCDFGSTAGAVLYAATDGADPGVDRVQTYGYGDGVICESPQEGAHLGGPHPDPAVVTWAKALGRPVKLANGFSQAELTEQNGGIMIFPDGLVGADGNQTSKTTYPKVLLPPNKVPTSVYVTGYSEFALVTIWDTDAMKGQIAVFALRSDTPPAFSIPYYALPNESGFKGVHLMGYVDLPDMKAPTAIAGTGNNGSSPGGHAIGNEFASTKDPTKNIATDEATRTAFAIDTNARWVASSGQAVVISRWENKVSFVDLRPLFQFVRDAYFTTKEKFTASAGQGDTWAYTFDTSPEAKPVVVTTLSVPSPTAVRVGNALSGFPKGLQTSLHAFVANVDGEVRMFDVSAFALAAPRPVPPASIQELAKIQVGRNVTAIRKAGQANVSIVVASRGDREIQWLEVGEKAITITRTLRDSRITDPVTIDPSARGPVITIGDFDGGRLLNFRVGKTENNSGKPPAGYGCGPGGVDADCKDGEFAGALVLPGAPYYVGTTNVN